MKESVIQSRLREKLEAAGWLVIKLIATSKPGIPDLLALRAGEAVFIEVKQIRQKARPLQMYRHDQLRRYGFKVIVARGLSDIDSLLN